jgi:A/G-specific adenine glycosylase
VVNGQLWEFPNVELNPGREDVVEAALNELAIPAVKLIPLGSLKHSITRHRITLDAFRVSLPPQRRLAAKLGRWVSRLQLERLPFTSAHRKLVGRLEEILSGAP